MIFLSIFFWIFSGSYCLFIRLLTPSSIISNIMAALLVAAIEAGIQLASLGLTISAEVLEAKIKAFYKEY